MFDFDYDDHLLYVRVTGQPTRADYEHAVLRAQEITGLKPGPRIWDVRETTLALSAEDLRQLASRSSRADSGDSRVALLANDDLTFGLSRMYSVFRENENVRVRVFRTLEGAKAWFAEPS